MEEDLVKVRTELKKFRKGACKSRERKRDDWSDDSNDSWSIGLDSMGELAHIANVAHKTNKRKIESYPTDLIKTIPLDVNHSSFLEQNRTPPNMIHVELQPWQLY